MKRYFFLIMIVGTLLAAVTCNQPISKTYTVTFNTQNIGTAPAALTVAEGSKLTAAQLPMPTNIPADKSFGGWFKEKEGKTPWDSNSGIVTKDITL
ncbi:MAG: InlB B-repeat-containing protein, partial [Treponema sp.]